MNLLKELNRWSSKYDFSFQFFGEDGNTIYLYSKNTDIILFEKGGLTDVESVIKEALDWVYKVNKVKPKVDNEYYTCTMKGGKDKCGYVSKDAFACICLRNCKYAKKHLPK